MSVYNMTDSDIINTICLPWVRNPYNHPVTGEKIDMGTSIYNELSDICDALINFDLLDLHTKDQALRSSPVVSFLTVAYICDRANLSIKHSYSKKYSPITGKGDPLLDNFDYGFVWNTTGSKPTLIPPKYDIRINTHTEQQLFLITILSPDHIAVNLLMHHQPTETWERFAPFGTNAQDDELDVAIQLYLDKHASEKFSRSGDYYSPIICPIPSEPDVPESKRKLVCALWDLWFLMYRLDQVVHIDREMQYEQAVAAALTDTPGYHKFTRDYLTYIREHKKQIREGLGLLDYSDKRTYLIDDFLAREIFSLLP